MDDHMSSELIWARSRPQSLRGGSRRRRMIMVTAGASPTGDAERRSSPSSPARSACGGSPTSRGAAVPSSPVTPSFFIIQEPTRDALIRSTPPSPTHSDIKTGEQSKSTVSASRVDLDRQRNALASRQSLDPTHSLNSGSPGPRRGLGTRTIARAAAVLHEETDEDLLGDDEDREAPSKGHDTSKHRVLSILNRVGSSPDLPLSNSWSAAVFSSSKKRQLMKSTNGTGASPHLASMQRSRLIPLPIDIRTGTLKKRDNEYDSHSSASSSLGARSSSLGSLHAAPQPTDHSSTLDTEEERMNYEISIGSLKQRVSYMEKELAKALKHRHVVESQLDALTKELHAVHKEKTQLTKKLDDYEKTNLHLRHAFDKLSQRYAIVYENLAKLSDATAEGGVGDPASVASVHLVIQTLTKENQELQRKVRVLETRHADDKVIVGNQEKQIKRLRAEMEALQHMAGSKDDTTPATNSSTTKPSSNDAINASRSTVGRTDSSNSVIPPPAVVSASVAQQQGVVVSDEYAYIDPNILKVLEKVDSQFSITNAISLSAMLKKWLHSCLHVVASTDTHAVLHVLLKRVCELMHCQHAAIFHVDHGSKKLLGLVSERGHVRWELPLDKGILGHAARQNVLCNVRKAYDDPRFFSSSDTITGTKSREVLCIPLTRELDHFQPDQATTIANNSVFAVLQCWNTTTQKPFSPNDQILGGLLGIQAGIVLSQTKLTDNLQRIHNRVLQIVHMNDELAAKSAARASPQDISDAVSGSGPGSGSGSAVSIVHLVRAAQRKFAEIVGITKLRIYIFDADTQRIWYAGAQLDATGASSSEVQMVPIRKYANVSSSLCALVLPPRESKHQDDADPAASDGCRILLDPTAEPTFNDTVDLKGGANGLYLAPIRSPWRQLPLGMIQVARTGSALQSSTSVPIDSRPTAAAVRQERVHTQQVDDSLTMELIELFCEQFAGLLHHALALQLHETCPLEVQQARLAYLTDHLDVLEREYVREQEEAEAEAEMMARQAMANVRLEEKLLNSVLQGQRDEAVAPTSRTSRSSRPSRPTSGLTARLRGEERDLLEPVPLISTDSSYAIDVLELADTSSASPDGTGTSSEEISSERNSHEGESGGDSSLLSSPDSF